MADLTITASSVQTSSSSGLFTAEAGEALTQGQVCYISSSDNKAYKAINNDTAAKAEAKGIVVNPVSTGGLVILCTSGDLTIGATLTVSTAYCVSSTAGGIAPIADTTSSTDYISILGVPKTTAILHVSISNLGYVAP